MEKSYIMDFLRVKSEYRDTLFMSCFLMVTGSILLASGLKHHLLSYNMLCIALLTPVAMTITFNNKSHHSWPVVEHTLNEQVDMTYEVGFLFITIMCMAMISMLQQDQYEAVLNKEDDYAFNSWLENVIGATLLGFGIGLYKRIANARIPAAPRYCTVHIFFLSVLSLVVTPYFKFYSVDHQIKDSQKDEILGPDAQAHYYENRRSVIVYFIVNGLLLVIAIYSIGNALQHPGL